MSPNIPLNLKGELKNYYLARRLAKQADRVQRCYQITATNPEWPEDPDLQSRLDELVELATELRASVKRK